MILKKTPFIYFFLINIVAVKDVGLSKISFFSPRAATGEENSSRSCPTLQAHLGGPAPSLCSQLAVPHLQQAHNLTAVEGRR